MFSLLNLHSGILKGKSYLIPLQFLFWALCTTKKKLNEYYE